MITPDDPRHGTYAGAVQHWFDKEQPCEPCKTAETRYRKKRQLRHLRGDAPRVPAIGTVRRFQALLALGWTGPQVAAEAGLSINTLYSICHHGSTTVRRETAEAMSDAFDHMCMVVPEDRFANRTRALARSRGWAPPLAWDNIDDPNEIPYVGGITTVVDEVLVRRVLDGDWAAARGANRGERQAVIDAWLARGGTQNELDRLTGWNVSRDLREAKENAA